MNIISYIFEPAVFFSVLVILLVVSVFVILSFLRQDKKLNRQIQDSINKDKMRISELEAALIKKEEEKKQGNSQLENTLKNKEEELKKYIFSGEARAKEQLKSAVSKLELELKEKEELWKKELAASSQMYEGLKEQYNELEKDAEKLTKELEKFAKP